ncbi:MAG: dioxygenase [Azospirillum sp.]|nr:dioxygenase [Azospirillum sp.]
MTKRWPTLFLSHGAPTLAVEDSPAHRFLSSLGRELGRPQAILVVSAHWQASRPSVSLAARPETIHDFGGFDRALYDLRYPAPGAPGVAVRVAELLEAAGFPVARDPNRGLDHGAWVPLSLLYPDAGIPVTQLSLVADAGPDRHLALGRALAALPDQGVLILASGSATHNLRAFFGAPPAAEPPGWVTGFAAWLGDALAAGDRAALVDYRRRSPFAAENHPTEEHLLPLFVALGAASSEAPGRRLHASIERGVLAMDSYAFD